MLFLFRVFGSKVYVLDYNHHHVGILVRYQADRSRMHTNSCCSTLIASHIISVNVVMGISIGGPFTMLISRPRWFAKMARATRRYFTCHIQLLRLRSLDAQGNPTVGSCDWGNEP